MANVTTPAKIKQEELRVGNWVENHPPFFELKPQYIQVTGMFIRQVEACKGGDANHKGIPLTPEILEKAGFKKWDDDPIEATYVIALNSKNRSQISLHIDLDNEYQGAGTSIENEGQFYHLSHECQYVHQLQNLFYCLCGEELKIDF